MKTLIVILVGSAAACTVNEGEGPPGSMNEGGGPPASVGNRIFVTSKVYVGGLLGGLDGADAKCNERAAAAGLPRTYKAWLSTLTDSPSSRMTHLVGKYTLVDGTLVASGWDDLVS